MNYPFENDTSAVIKKLARKSVRFDKKKNLFCLSAIIVAVAMIMMSCSQCKISFIKIRKNRRITSRDFL